MLLIQQGAFQFVAKASGETANFNAEKRRYRRDSQRKLCHIIFSVLKKILRQFETQSFNRSVF